MSELTGCSLQSLKNAQARARRVGMRLSKRRDVFTLYGPDNRVVARGDYASVLAHMPDRRKYAGQGKPNSDWQALIDDYMLVLRAAGQPATTTGLRRIQLARMGRELGGIPAELTAERLVAWFGAQSWASETRRSNRGAIRGFLRWAYKTGRIPVHLAD